MRTNGRHFYNRTNRDGTYTSICTQCHITVAAAGRESDLVVRENLHICDPATAYRVSQYIHQVIAIVDGFAERTESRLPPHMARMLRQ